ncbi:uncharacterized protein J8A68_002084 [[Candida] subhashii]|uniref:Sterol regulatory element-binding protein cleavage-activating protein n=1 Tax=[Candida] subhashii TaxID=561895 RepID=A0A8J5UQ11_9ASCO|nr:uncharacterized protein J8A68_002084 [[Candida] subhashii]KAG7664411.1 hypothetical protein J8A68_002084 [[Candida] subhashii]
MTTSALNEKSGPSGGSSTNFIKSSLIHGIRSILIKPSLFIIIPALIIFLLSYDTLYDFNIKKLNCQLATHFSSGSSASSITNYNTNTKLNSILNELNSIDIKRDEFIITRVSLTNNLIGNTFTFQTFQQVQQVKSLIKSDCPNCIIISPADLISLESTNTESLSFKRLLRQIFNYNLNILLTFLFIDEFTRFNQIIQNANVLKLYIIHNNQTQISHILNESLSETNLSITNLTTTPNMYYIKGFIKYFITQTNLSFKSFYFISDIIVLLQLSSFMIFMYLVIANGHKIRSNVGLLYGWIVETVMCCIASVNLINRFHGKPMWEISEPSNTFIKLSYIFIVLLLSSRSLYLSIDSLSDSKYNRDIHRRLYHYYAGLKGIPVITKILFTNIVSVISMSTIINIILVCSFRGDYLHSISQHLFYLVEAIVVALILESIMELTFITGIIIVDLKKLDLIDVIKTNQEVSSSNDTPIEIENLSEGANTLSSILLKLDSPSHSRPNKDSTRYKLGQSLLSVRFRDNILQIYSIATLLQLLIIFVHWSLLIPKGSVNNPLIDVAGLTIISEANSIIYYIEFLLIIGFICAIAAIIFKLNPPKMTIPAASTEELDFGQEEIQAFNSIELGDANNGHQLDIIKIQSNTKCSFVVSIGLDHKVFIWSPLSELRKPIDISSMVDDNNEFWPINHVGISDDGSYIILISFKYGLIKCFNRNDMKFSWIHINSYFFASNKCNVLEAFFRKRTIPGHLMRQILINSKKSTSSPLSRKGSDVSINSQINGSLPPPPPIVMKSHGETQRQQQSNASALSQQSLAIDEYVLVLESGELIVYSCNDGKTKSWNIISSIYGNDNLGEIRIVSSTKLKTPRVNDRIVCLTSTNEIIIATVVNNNWKFRRLPIKEGQYNQENKLKLASAKIPNLPSHDFSAIHKEKEDQRPEELPKIKGLQLNPSCIYALEFVGMIMKVEDLTASLIDIQTGIVLKTFNIGNFKPNTFQVSHSEPTHCKFCGCASVQSFSIIYEDCDSNTIFIQTFKIDAQRSKNNICLRVERDPREIRCLGFSAVSEHQYWFKGITEWQITDVNMIIGVKKSAEIDDDEDEEQTGVAPEIDNGVGESSFDHLVENSGLMSLRSRRHRRNENKNTKQSGKSNGLYEGFIIDIMSGKCSTYALPRTITDGTVSTISKYGFKSIICNFGKLMEIFYLGNDKLIENDIYYNADIWSTLEEDKDQMRKTMSSPSSRPPQPVNSELLFINKRRKQRQKQQSIKISE